MAEYRVMNRNKIWQIYLWGLILVLAMLLLPLKAQAEDTDRSGQCGENVYWDYTAATGELVISGTGAMYDYESISDLPWADLRRERKITKVTVGNGITRIGKQAFRSMANVLGPEWTDSLKEVVIADSVKEVGDYAFYNCNALKSADIPDSVQKIGIGAFAYCKQMISITFGNGIKAIGTAAFAYSGITALELPDSVVSLGDEKRGEDFTDTSYMLPFDINSGSICYFCSNLKRITLPSGLTKVPERMFYYCKSLAEITIPDSVTAIDSLAFMGCRDLRSIVLPEKMTSIAEKTFMDCTNLTEVGLPEGLTDIGEYAFCLCESLAEIELPKSLRSIGESAFSSSGVQSVDVPSGLETIGYKAFGECKNLASVHLPGSVQRVGGSAFASCSNLTELQLDEGIKSIGENAFSSCGSLVKAELPQSMEILESGLFSNCSSLRSVRFPEGLKRIGQSAFRRCTSLKGVELPDSLESLDRWAFDDCESLETTITLPASLKQVDGSVFSGTPVTSYKIAAGNPYFCVRDGVLLSVGQEELIAYPSAKTGNYIVPDGVKLISAYAFYKSRISSVVIPDGVREIGEDAFYGSSLSSVAFPDNLKKIGEDAFYDCDSLEELSLPKYLQSAGVSFVAGCDSLKSLTVYQYVTSIRSVNMSALPSLTTIRLYQNSRADQEMKSVSGLSEKIEYMGVCREIYTDYGTYGSDKKELFATENIIWLVEGEPCGILPEPEISQEYQGQYTFDGWYTAKTGGVKLTGDTVFDFTGLDTKDGQDVIYAHYKDKNRDGVSRYTYKFGNSRKDFGYAPDYKIKEESIFTKLWGNTELAKDNYNRWVNELGEWNGNCYGMSATSIMFNDNRDDIEIADFNPSAMLVKGLGLTDYNRNDGIRMSLLDFIEVMQITQIDETVSTLIWSSNRNKVSRLCSAVKTAEEEDTAVIIVLDRSGTSRLSHALVGYRMEDVSGTERRVYVYDCNHPEEERYITLTMENGSCTGWRYDGSTDTQKLVWDSRESGDANCTISHITYDSFIKVWLNRSLEEKPASEKNIMTLNVASASICDKDGQEVAVLEDGEILSENEEIFAAYPIGVTMDGSGRETEIQPMIYLPTGEYIVKNTDQKIGEMKLTMCNVDRKAVVSTTVGSVLVNVNDSVKINTIQVIGQGKVEAGFYSSDTSEKYSSMNYTGQSTGSSTVIGASGGQKIVVDFNIDSEKVENKDGTVEKPQDPQNPQDPQKPQKPQDLPFRLASPTGSNKIAAGKKIKLAVTGDTKKARTQKLTYSTSNKKLATVNQKGVVSVKKNAGGKKVTITAVNAAGRKVKLKLTIMKGAVKKIQISGKKKCKVGKTLKLKAKITAGKGANKTLLWKSSNTRYAEVTKKGIVKAKKPGKGKRVKITAAATDGSGKKASVTVAIQ